MNIASGFTRSKGKFVCLDAAGNEVAPGSPNMVSVRTEGFTLLRNGVFKVTATYLHPCPPPPSRRRCKTRNGKLPAPAPEHLADADLAAEIAAIDTARIEPSLDPPTAIKTDGDDIEITYFIKAGGILTK